MSALPRFTESDSDPGSGPSTAAPGMVSLDDGRRSVTLRPRGAGRFAVAAFLTLWLCGWVAGELFAGGALLATALATFAPGVLDAIGIAGRLDGLTGAGAPVVMLFLAVWVTFWTFGGLAAMRELMRMVAASDRIVVGAGDIELDPRLGPFRSVHRLAAADVRRVVLDRRGAVVATTKDATIVLSALGTTEERAALASWLDQALGIGRDDRAREAERERQRRELPLGWESAPDDVGRTLLRRPSRTTGARSRSR